MDSADVAGTATDSQKLGHGRPRWAIGRDTLVFALVVLLFVISGFSSLIYQVVWTRLLVFVFGSTTFASSTVLAVFMGGLALGSFLAGRVSDRLKRPFLWYGILEGVIGLWALAAPAMFDAAVPLYRAAWQQFHFSVIPFSLVRFIVAAAILLVPTTCMGATLPLLARFVTGSLSMVGNRVGTLYASNTLGAVAGAVLAGFFLLPAFGLTKTIWLAVAFNLLLCLVVVVASKRYERDAQSAEAGEERAKEKLPLVILAVMFAFAVSGAVAMIYEVAWTRTLLMIIGSSTYAFTVMLTTFLVGIFLGSLIVSRWVDRLNEPVAWFACIEIVLCFAGMMSIYSFNYLPYLNLQINSLFVNNPQVALLVRFLLAAAVLLPITLCLGAIFPVVVKTCTRSLEAVGRSVGTLYSCNTLGAIIGAFLAGFVIIPLIGAEKTLVYASVANLVLGACLLGFVNSIRTQIKAITVVAALGLMVWCAMQEGVWDKLTLISAQTQRRAMLYDPRAAQTLADFDRWRDLTHRTSKILFWKDGACATVGVMGYPSGQHSLLTNGHVDASDSVDMANQILIGAYPLLFKPDAKNVAVVGWGSGVTIGAATLFPVKNLFGIEIEPAVIEAARYFNHVNCKPESDPRVKIEVNDGRNYLMATDEEFDVVISQPSNPWQAGVCNLFTKEYFQICNSRLKKDGIFALWMQYDEVSKINLVRVLAALRSVFPYTVPITSDEGYMIVLAGQQPVKLDYKKAAQLIADPKLGAQLARANIHNVDDVLARILCSSNQVGKFTAGVDGNSDDHNKLEYEVGKTYENAFFLEENEHFLEQNTGTLEEAVDWDSLAPEDKAAAMARAAHVSIALKAPQRALEWSSESIRLAKSPAGLRANALAELELGNVEEANKRFDEALQLNQSDAATLLTRGTSLLIRGDALAARKDLLQAVKLAPSNAMMKLRLAQSYVPVTIATMNHESLMQQFSKDDAAAALATLGGLARDPVVAETQPDVLLVAALSYSQLGDSATALNFYKQYLHKRPSSVLGWRALGTLYYTIGDTNRASACWDQSLRIGKNQATLLAARATRYLQMGEVNKAVSQLARAVELYPGNQEVVGALQTLSTSNANAAAALRAAYVLQPGGGQR